MRTIFFLKTILKKILPKSLFKWYHLKWAHLSAVFYGHPSKKLKVIGVTGTNGKTTVVYLINHILEEAGYETAFYSSVEYKVGENKEFNKHGRSMPGWGILQRFLKKAALGKCQYAILEVTSQGILQYRHRYINFNTAVLTNITPEHIEAHGSFKQYVKAKGRLFRALKGEGKSVVNLDDKNARYFLRFKALEKWVYKRNSESMSQNLVFGTNYQLTSSGIKFNIQDVSFEIPLFGEFNIENALAAITVCLSEGILLDIIAKALRNVKEVPGRFEILTNEPFKVIVDYAHTPDALEKVYQTCKNISSGKLIGVLGSAGGGRDLWKRPQMGKIAEKYLDNIIITNEDPYDEDPWKIIEEVASGVENKEADKILDRREAIKKAIQLAKAGDLVIITGKGCQQYIYTKGGDKLPFDDRQVVKNILNN